MSVSGSSTGFNVLFEKPKVRADPEDVRQALNAALEDCGSTLGVELDLGAIENAAAEAEKKAGEDFMKHEIKMHEVDDEFNELKDDGGGREEEEEEEEEEQAARLASISFAEEALGSGKPEGLNPPPDVSKSRRRLSSGLSSYDETAYNMGGGDAHKFSQKYMVSKWKKEARVQFEQARGNKVKARFEDGEDYSDSFAEDVSTSTCEPGEVPKHTRMRLARIDGAKVIRHQLNIDGLYGTMEKTMMKNLATMDDILEKSMDRLETRKEIMRLAHDAIQLKKEMEAEKALKREAEEEEQRKIQISLGSTLNGISDLLNMDTGKFANDEKVLQKLREAEARSRSSSISSASY